MARRSTQCEDGFVKVEEKSFHDAMRIITNAQRYDAAEQNLLEDRARPEAACGELAEPVEGATTLKSYGSNLSCEASAKHGFGKSYGHNSARNTETLSRHGIIGVVHVQPQYRETTITLILKPLSVITWFDPVQPLGLTPFHSD